MRPEQLLLTPLGERYEYRMQLFTRPILSYGRT